MRLMTRALLVLAAAAVWSSPGSAQPQIQSLSPQPIAANLPTSTLTIQGTGFGSMSDAVNFPGVGGVTPLTASAGQLTVAVPGTWSGNLTVTAGGQTSPAAAFVVSWSWSGHAWPSGSLPFTWELNQNGAPGVNLSQVQSALQLGFNAWQCASNADVIYGGTTTAQGGPSMDGRNVIYWTTAPWADPGLLAVATHWYNPSTGAILEGDIHFNGADWTWGVDGSSGVADIEGVGTHEIGHILGLLDLYGDADSHKTMYGISGNGDTHARDLAVEDVIAVEHLYPRAGRPNLTKGVPTGWWGSIVPHPFDDATNSSSPLPATLTGNWAGYVSVGQENTGLDCAAPTSDVYLFLDDVALRYMGWYGSFGAGTTFPWPNEPVTVRDGRHTLAAQHDATGAIIESDETDNWDAQQFAWSPYGLADRVPVVRAAPPDIGSGVYVNCLAHQFTGNWWGAVGAVARDAQDDYDLLLFDEYSSSLGSYTTFLAASGAGAGMVDFLVVNGNVVGSGETFTAASHRYSTSGNADSLVVCQTNQVGAVLTPTEDYGEFASTGSVTLVSDELVAVHEVYLPNPGYYWTVELNNVSGGADLGFNVIDAAEAYGNRYGNLVTTNDHAAGEDEGVVFSVSQAGYYGVVVYKSTSADAPKVVNYELRVGIAPSNLVPSSATLYKPVLPRSDALASPTTTSLTDSLYGNQPLTWISHAIEQTGPSVVPSGWGVQVRLDDEQIVDQWVTVGGYVLPDEMFRFNEGPLEVRGGRHTLSVECDHDGVLFESNEGDNIWSGQYVWSPLELAPDVSYLRPVPPASGLMTLRNTDGLAIVPDPGQAWVFAMAPLSDQDDYDILLYDDYGGSEVGFSNIVAASGRPSNLVDVIVGHDQSSGVPYYPGVLRYLSVDAEPYVAQWASSAGNEAPGGTAHWPDRELVAEQLAHVYDVYMEAGQRYFLSLVRLQGDSDLSLLAYPNTAGSIYGRQDPAEQVGVPVGSDQWQMICEGGASDGWHPIVVARTDTGFIGQEVLYSLLVEPTDRTAALPEGLPTRLALGPSWPNPCSSQTRFEFTLPEDLDVRMEIFDVRGRRVRTLLARAFPRGAHAAIWNTCDDRGQRVAVGTYWARLQAGDQVRTQKLTVLR